MTEFLLSRVTELVARHLGRAVDEVAPEREFVELGADSFQMVGLPRELAERMGTRISIREIEVIAEARLRILEQLARLERHIARTEVAA